MLKDHRRNLFERLVRLRVSKRIHLRARDVHLGDDAAIERKSAVDRYLANRTQLGCVARFQNYRDTGPVVQFAGIDGDVGIAFSNDREIVSPGRNHDREGTFRIGRRSC